MSKKQETSHRLLAAIALTAALFTLTPWGVQIDNALYDGFSSTQSEERSQNVVVVGIDEPSFQQLGMQWPWPRQIHGELIDQLSEAGARVIAFDLLFPEESNSKSDQLFAEAIARALPKTSVVIGTDFKIIDHPQYRIRTPIEPIGTLTDAGATTGHVSIGIDADGFVRRLKPSLEGSKGLAVIPAEVAQPGSTQDLPNEFLINYGGGTRAIKQASYYQALNAEQLLPENFFKNKIVFVGVRSLTAVLPDRQSADHYPTPLTRWRSGYTSGVMIHALAAASILEGSWISQVSRLGTAIIGLLAALLYIRFGLRQSLRKSVASGVATVSLIGIVIFIVLQARNLYIPILNASFPLLCITLFSPYYNYLLERRQKQAIRKAFSSYVNQDIVRQIEDDPDSLKLGGKQIDGTVLFMDIAGFSGLSETESPEVMIGFINDFLSAMIEIGMANGGTVERFLGDAIMLIWGAPTEEPDHARLACKTALAMSEKIEVVSQSAQEQYGFKVSARIGINSGSMTAGNIGGQERFCYTVLGDSVNLAARFEAANKNYGSTILIGESTKSITAASFYSRLIDITKVKGRESLQSIYELVGEAKEIETQYMHYAEQYENALKALIAGDPRKADRLLNEDGALLPAVAGVEQLNDRIKAALKELPPQTNSF